MASSTFVVAGRLLVAVVVVATASMSGPARAATAATSVQPPVVTAVSPARGTGYQPVLVKGAHLNGATAVLFGSQPATELVVESPTAVLAVAPRERAGQVDVLVKTAAGTSAQSPADRFTFLVPAAPTVADYSVDQSFSYAPSVSCPSLAWCASTDEIGGNAENPLAFTVVAGTQSQTFSIPLPPGGDVSRASIGAVSCSTAGSCVAVGTRDYRFGAMIVTLDGNQVSSVAVDGTAAAPRTVLNDTSCSSALCVAVGGDFDDADFRSAGAVFERQADGSWVPVALPIVPVLRAVSCAGTSCVALEGAGGAKALVRTAGGWRRSSIPAPSGGSAPVATDVDCYAQGACMAAGSFRTASGEQRQMFARWSGGSWSAVAVPRATTLTGDLSGGPIDCTADGVCFAAASGASYSSRTVFVARLKGNSVSVTALPIPTDRGSIVYATITDLACSSVTYCVAGGAFQVDDPEFGTIYYDAMVLSNGVWTYRDSARSSAVSCAPDNFCGLALDSEGSSVVLRTMHRK